MRHILYLLLVTNLVYLGWNLLQTNTNTTADAQLPPLPPAVKPLVTLQESRQQSAATDTADTTDTTNTTEITDTPDTTVISVIPDTTNRTDTPIIPVAPDPSASSGDAVVLDELTIAEPPGAGSRANDCQALGPFETEADAQAVAPRLVALGIQPHQRSAEAREENGYWVYLPSMDRETALEIAHKLDEQGDTDYFIGKDNYISLGTYQGVARAEVRLRQVHKLGLDALLEVRYRTHQAYWLEFRDTAGSAQEIAAIMSEQPGLQLHALACL